MGGNDNGWRSPPDEDGALARRVAVGDLNAFGLLYDRYAGMVFALAAHLLGASDAEEAVQESFLRLWRSAKQFDPDRGAFAAWFMTIARNVVMHELRERSQWQRIKAAEAIDAVLARAADTTGDVEEHAVRRERGQIALAALNDLPAEQRQVLVLAYFGGLSQSAIAGHLDLPLGTVKKRTRLGLGKLRQALARQHLLDPAATTSEQTTRGMRQEGTGTR